MKYFKTPLILLILIMLPMLQAATLTGTVYNDQLEIESNVLIEINNQKFLAKDGSYTFDLAVGTYNLTARKGDLTSTEKVKVELGGNVYDIFILDEFTDENELWEETNVQYFSDVPEPPAKWRYYVLVAVFILAIWRVIKVRRKYGPLRKFRRESKLEQKKTIAEHKEEISREPGYLERTLEIIRKNDGRISQKDLRKEMLPLSEAKISLIITELEHNNKVEKIKKGRGNIILLKK